MEAELHFTALALAGGAAFILFAGGFWAIASLGQWALAPAQRAVAPVRAGLQFSFRDLLVLLLQTQAVVFACLWWCDGTGVWTATVVLVAIISTLAMWGHGVRRLSQAGVRSALRRGVFLLLVAPSTCAVIVAALWINGRAVVELLTAQPSPWLGWLAQNVLVLAAFILCRLATVWVMSDMRRCSTSVSHDGDAGYVSS